MTDPEYVDIEEEFGSGWKKPKWMLAETQFQSRVLAIFKMKYFPSKSVKSFFKMIEKSMVPFAINPDNPPIYPTEWVEEKLSYVTNQRRNGVLIQLDGLITMLKNESNRQQWCERQKTKQKAQRGGTIVRTGNRKLVINDTDDFD